MILSVVDYILLIFTIIFVVIRNSFFRELVLFSVFSIVMISRNINALYFIVLISLYILFMFKNDDFIKRTNHSLRAISYLVIIIAFGFGVFFLSNDYNLQKIDFNFEIEKEYLYVLFAIINLSIFRTRNVNDI